jgi:hypothetical protein
MVLGPIKSFETQVRLRRQAAEAFLAFRSLDSPCDSMGRETQVGSGGTVLVQFHQRNWKKYLSKMQDAFSDGPWRAWKARSEPF